MPPETYCAMETLPEVGARFRALRKQAGKTQSELAGAVGMRQEMLSRWFASRPDARYQLRKNMGTQTTPQQNTAAYIAGFEDGKRVNAAITNAQGEKT